MTTFGYADRPAGVTGPTQRTPVNERLEPAPRAAADGMRGLAVRGEGRRVRNRTHHNEAPPRPATPGGNAKTDRKSVV